MDFWTMFSYCMLLAMASVLTLICVYFIICDFIDKVDEVRRLKNGSEEEN